MNLVDNKPGYTRSVEPPLFFIMMRFNLKVTLLFLFVIGILTILTLYSFCGSRVKEWGNINSKSLDVLTTEEIDCEINGDYIIGCRKEGDDVYLPFSFLHRYFEVYGKLATYDGVERFEWSHSYSKVYRPKSKYDPKGVFMYFENYNVEVRDRVKCVSAIEGVPVSTQWESQGYYYPTQIAQFGLSHFSKNLTEPEPRRKMIDDSDRDLGKWIIPSTAKFERIIDNNFNSKILKFITSDSYEEGIRLKMDHVLYFVMSLDLILSGNSSVTITLQNRETKQIYFLHYITSDVWITSQDNNIYHGIGTKRTWKKLTRDLIVDLHKGISFFDKDKSKIKLSRSKMRLTEITLRGSGCIDNLTLSSSEHIQQFYDTAEWFVKHQDKQTGGWPIPVKRKLAPGFQDLQPGWYSSMSQGHAISVLSRAYYHSGGDIRYLTAALLGLKPFKVSSDLGGVRASFLDKYPWYEEYPTQPASFVLNGFIYSLLGLYDLMSIAPLEDGREAEVLFNDGMVSLRRMISLFDMGSVTSYDLRHFTISTAPNLARWDYHATHVNQLLLLSTIDGDSSSSLFKVTAERWIGYMNGKRADHN
ncbi:D-glucuronyl C5-epimerase B [Diorhabda sublineata]|uniref:D-glucuronyl C5-epimerase B n=1 Tax=Diorhabda sublineata TaxID=1163346 RepID=UPI0024E11B07|nr:D-glucuronyl C5-epimerase B [Diorhabda sublineata]